MTQPTENSAHQPGAPGETVGRPARSGVTGLADKAASGFIFMVVQTLGVRVFRFGGQFLLAWLLFPDDFALFGLSTTVHQFVSVLKNAGLRDILIHRQSRIHRWVNPAIWMSGAFGVGGGLVMAISAPAMAWFFGRSELIPMVLVLALTTPFQSLGQVPTAMLHAQLRYKTAATVEAMNTVTLMLLTVYFAWAGLGALSFVLPMLIVAVCRTAYLWWLMKPRVLARPQLRRWRYLIGDSARLISADVARTITYQADYIVLGRVFPGSAAIGHYFYGYQLSTQSVMLFAKNLDIILLPALSKLQDDAARHTQAFLRAIKTMAAAGIPLCFLQAAAAGPAVRLLLPDRFLPTVPFMVVLSIGMAGQLMIQPATAMIRSQGRFTLFVWLTWIHAAVFIVAVVAAAVLGSALAAAFAVAGDTAVFGAIMVFVALKGLDDRTKATIGVFFWPVVAGGISCGGAWLCSTLIPGDHALTDLLRLAVVCLVAGAIYVPLIRAVERDVFDEIYSRTIGVLRSRLRGRSPSA